MKRFRYHGREQIFGGISIPPSAYINGINFLLSAKKNDTTALDLLIEMFFIA